MASNFTANYGLSQWEAEDAVRRVDFNEDNAKIDAAIKAVDRRVDGKADVSALNGLSSRVDGLSSTVSSQGSSLSSHGSAISRLGNCQIYTGTYTGDGSGARSLSFPGYPVYVYLRDTSSKEFLSFLRGANYASGSYTSTALIPGTWSSRGLSWEGNSMNRSNIPYVVMALLDMSK